MGGLINYLPTIKYSVRPGNIDCNYTMHARTPWCFYTDVHGHSLWLNVLTSLAIGEAICVILKTKIYG